MSTHNYTSFDICVTTGVIEQVRDGSTVRVEVQLDPENVLSRTSILLYLAGVQCPKLPHLLYVGIIIRCAFELCALKPRFIKICLSVVAYFWD